MRHIGECVNEVLADLIDREAAMAAAHGETARAALVAAKGCDGDETAGEERA